MRKRWQADLTPKPGGVRGGPRGRQLIGGGGRDGTAGVHPAQWATQSQRSLADPHGKPARAYDFLEADRGTIPVTRQNLSQSSFYRKLVAYEATRTQSIHRTRLGLHRFRVLSVTSSPERVETLVEACRQLARGQGLFLFTDAESFRAHSNPLAMEWVSVRENAHETLLDSLLPADPSPRA